MRVFWYIVGILGMILLVAGMHSFRVCAVRKPQMSPHELLARRAKRWGLPPEALQGPVDWFLGQNPETLTVTAFDGIQLSGRWLPAEQSRGRVLMFHGHRSGGLEDFCTALPFYHEQGLDILLVDQRAHGESGGKFIGMGVLERRDCLSWVEEINRRFGADKPTILAGVSMGSTTVQLAAAEPLPDNVRGVVADCGFTSPWDITAYQMRRQLHLPPFPLVHMTSGFCRLLVGYGHKDVSVPEALKTCRLPILFLHGETDEFVPLEMVQRCYEGHGGDKQLYLVPNADHTAVMPMGGEGVRQVIRAFLDKYL